MTEPETPEPGTEESSEAESTNDEATTSDAARVLESEEGDELLGALSSLRRAAAPPDLGDAVAERIRERSAGRFFGRPTLADRVWILVLALIVITLGLGLFLLMRSSDTGSLKFEKGEGAPAIAPGAREALPKP